MVIVSCLECRSLVFSGFCSMLNLLVSSLSKSNVKFSMSFVQFSKSTAYFLISYASFQCLNNVFFQCLMSMT